MKIDGTASSQAIDLYRKAETPQQSGVEETGKVGKTEQAAAQVPSNVADDVSISDEARLRSIGQEAVAKVPDVRSDLVDKFSQLIESGEYNPKGEDIAESILSSFSIKI